ncbi:unnamed protein product [Didymodactylos carnosus]|uniref:Fucosyltransferase n=1 Tax=Didymodactylos carnosus TaxID=1234261 RepID=A0A814BXW5_9BILA|nr:unnamed protein product [Didymodactylos carnosus]CAF1360152.1 unnamed protein product [Didymodactylos carnosus]CAF3711535.1 unnamed protein product [Didymodactylos carnosus]CAF4170238.1 unnamed protein product [Didymodactylos carnosus]
MSVNRSESSSSLTNTNVTTLNNDISKHTNKLLYNHTKSTRSFVSISQRNEKRLHQLNHYYLSLNSTLFLLSSDHTTRRKNKTLIYQCKYFCGGFGDRLRGIMSVYILALITGRQFMINMHYPCNVKHVLEPNLYNWTFEIPSGKRSQLVINTMSSYMASYKQEMTTDISRYDFIKKWEKHDDIYITTNSDYMTPALKNPFVKNSSIGRILFGQLPTYKTTQAYLFPVIFEILFKPSVHVTASVNHLLRMVYSRNSSMLCLHIRVGKNPNNPHDYAFPYRSHTADDMIAFVDNSSLLVNRSQTIFVTSDSGEAISKILNHYPDRSLTIPGPIIHVDRFDKGKTVCDGFTKVIADFYALGECQTSILSPSGFSAWANKRRFEQSKNLYIYNDKQRQMRKG